MATSLMMKGTSLAGAGLLGVYLAEWLDWFSAVEVFLE